MTNKKEIFESRTVFSGAEAAQYVGVPWPTFKHHVFVQGNIPNSAMVGNRRCFTREQLDEYRQFKSSVLPFDTAVYTFAEAGEYLGLTRSRLSHYVYESHADLLPYEHIGVGGRSRRTEGKTSGGVVVFTKEVLDNFKKEVLEGLKDD